MLVLEQPVPPGTGDHLVKAFDLEMLVDTGAGRERTVDEYRALFLRAGLRVDRVVPVSISTLFELAAEETRPPMRYGVTMFATDQTWRIDEVAVEAEARGFASLWLPEHTHIPTSRKTPPPTGDAVLAEGYKRMFDPFIALAAAGARTERIRLGTGIALIAQHEPIATAKTIATLDHLTDGRVDLGIGFGWNIDEMESHGIDPARRRDLVREHILTMRTLWSDEVAEFRGEFVDLAPSWAWPKPTQPAGRRCLLGVRPHPRRSPPSPSTATAGSRSAGPASARRSPRSTPRARRSGGTRRRCRSPRSAPSTSRPSSSTTSRSASRRSCSGSRRASATRSCPSSTASLPPRASPRSD